jgi:myo-inositol-1(or 4)-monophosphatase
MTDPRTLIDSMKAAARLAGESLRRDFADRASRVVTKKAAADFVSDADVRAEAAVREVLSSAHPDFGLLMEESGAHGQTERRFIVDPLDGTTNFLHGIPHFAVSIGAEVDGRLIAGVIYEPIHGELYSAIEGGGAWLGTERLSVSKETTIAQAIFATGVPFLGRGDHPKFLRELAGVMAVSAGVRRFGAAALDLAWVAAGRFDGFWEADLKPWDLAAGILLVEEAGGKVRDFEGAGRMLQTGQIVTTPPALMAPLVAALGL